MLVVFVASMVLCVLHAWFPFLKIVKLGSTLDSVTEFEPIVFFAFALGLVGLFAPSLVVLKQVEEKKEKIGIVRRLYRKLQDAFVVPSVFLLVDAICVYLSALLGMGLVYALKAGVIYPYFASATFVLTVLVIVPFITSLVNLAIYDDREGMPSPLVKCLCLLPIFVITFMIRVQYMVDFSVRHWKGLLLFQLLAYLAAWLWGRFRRNKSEVDLALEK